MGFTLCISEINWFFIICHNMVTLDVSSNQHPLFCKPDHMIMTHGVALVLMTVIFLCIMLVNHHVHLSSYFLFFTAKRCMSRQMSFYLSRNYCNGEFCLPLIMCCHIVDQISLCLRNLDSFNDLSNALFHGGSQVWGI